MSTILQKASNAINLWNEVRNNTAATQNYFSKGTYFSIDRSDFATWHTKWQNLNKPSNFYIHAYLGLKNYSNSTSFSLCLYSVDSNTDSKKVLGNENEYLTNIKFSPYHPSNLTNPIFNSILPSSNHFGPLEALERSTQWTLHKNTWLSQQTNMTQILVIPFKDLTTLFNNSKIESVICQPALKYDSTTKNHTMDLIIWGHSNKMGILEKYPQDLIRPVPPFSFAPNKYNLLSYSI